MSKLVSHCNIISLISWSKLISLFKKSLIVPLTFIDEGSLLKFGLIIFCGPVPLIIIFIDKLSLVESFILYRLLML